MSKQCPSANPCTGPGYESPEAAHKNGLREQILFVTCPSVDSTHPDMLATVDVDPESDEYCKVKKLEEMFE